eukprot:TRINITY_DN1203_c1_g2_i4.p1 TRINITY_DN1203_c1_g2~~TRINITY_DN1203_c1_g2_i4.p1  ORF type:complete len:509 (-),score=128.13 TRINITY_DN1203_c1_g2_i4:154-1680(-)
MESSEETIPLSKLTVWAESVGNPPILDGSPNPLRAAAFPVSEEMNHKVYMWTGEIWRLEIDAIVNPTNESLSDHSGVSGRILRVAGPRLETECQLLDGCRTGEARITGGYNLPAKHVIHTVGPRYDERYITAAEHALHSCYRSSMQLAVENKLRTIAFASISTERKSYPMEDAAHVAFRTIRRFLELFGESIDAVVIVAGRPEEVSVAKRLLPLYFPRTEEEELIARSLLPEDIGNKFGESVVKERKIRISAFPLADDEDDEEGEAPDAIEETPSGSGLPEEKDPGAPVLDPSFARMQGDVDHQKRRELSKRPSTIRKEEEAQLLYARYLKRAMASRFDEFQKMNFCYECGTDILGRPIVVFVAKNLPAKEVNMEHVLLFIIKTLHTVVDRDYVAVLFQSESTAANRPAFGWMKNAYKVLNRPYKKNMKALYIVHPTFWTKFVLGLCRPFISKKFWKKVQYVNQVSDLFKHIDRSQIKVPQCVFEHDRVRNGTVTSPRESEARKEGDF